MSAAPGSTEATRLLSGSNGTSGGSSAATSSNSTNAAANSTSRARSTSGATTAPTTAAATTTSPTKTVSSASGSPATSTAAAGSAAPSRRPTITQTQTTMLPPAATASATQAPPSYQSTSAASSTLAPPHTSTLRTSQSFPTLTQRPQQPLQPSAAQLAAAAALLGRTSSSQADDNDDVSDSEMEDSIVLKDGRRFPTAGKEKHVKLLQLMAIVYFCVINGPYGLEDAFMAGGLSWVCILLVILPWLIHWPIGLLTSELASAMPQNGGYILWVSRAFGNFWGLMEGWLSFASALFDNALYPFLITAYIEYALEQVAGVEINDWVVYGIRVGLCAVVALLNLVNVQMQGNVALLFAFLCLLPFVVLTIIGIGKINFINCFTNPWSVAEVDWGLLLSSLLWVGSGWDSPGTVAGDVKQPKQTYPRAVTIAVALCMITNLLPSMVAFSLTPEEITPQSQKQLPGVETTEQLFMTGDLNSFWAQLAKRLGGPWLAMCVIIVALFGNLNMLHVLFTSTSWSLYAVALPGLLDAPFLTKLQDRWRTPYVCIVFTFVGLTLCCLASFAILVQVTMALNFLALSLQCMALVWLRITEPKMKRPYRIPMSTKGVAMCMVPPMAMTVLLVVTIESRAMYLVAAFTLAGVLAYLVARLIERVYAVDSGVRPEHVDLADVFEDVVESVADSKPDDRLPDLGFRSSMLTHQLPESIRHEPTEVNDNVGDVDHSLADQIADLSAEDSATEQSPEAINALIDKSYQQDEEAPLRYANGELPSVKE